MSGVQIPDPWIVKPEKFGLVIVTDKGSQEMCSEDGTSQAGENGDNLYMGVEEKTKPLFRTRVFDSQCIVSRPS
jgi:hypothetical protein